MSDKESFDRSIAADKQSLINSKSKNNSRSHGAAYGLGVAIIAMLAILLWQNSNLSTVLSRRSPFMEYTICYNQRDAAERKAYNQLLNVYIGDNSLDPNVVVQLRRNYNDASDKLRDATDIKSDDPCPGLDVINDN